LFGCEGSNEYISDDYVIKYQDGHFELESDYPYKAIDPKSQYDCQKGITIVAPYVREQDEEEKNLADNVENNGPFSIAIDANNWSFTLYSSGVYNETDCSSTLLDYAVGFVGFGSEKGSPYWIVQNS
jgi:cathepsin L